MSQCSQYLLKKGLFEYIKVIYRREGGTSLMALFIFLFSLLGILEIKKIPPTTTGAHHTPLALNSFFLSLYKFIVTTVF
jgi:hypothetical protein